MVKSGTKPLLGRRMIRLLEAFDRKEISERCLSMCLSAHVQDFWENYWSDPSVRKELL